MAQTEKEFIDNYYGEEALEFYYEDDSESALALSKELMAFYRTYPSQACEDLLGLKLVYTQRCMLNVMWKHPNVAEVLSRGMSKTFVLAVYMMLRLMLYADLQIGVVSKTYRQSQQVFKYVKQIEAIALRQDKNFFTQQVRKIRVDAYCTEIETKHGSIAFAVPVGRDGDTARGKRCHILLVDEAAIVPLEIIDAVVKAYLNVKGPLSWGRDNIGTNQKVYCSSACPQDHWFFNEVISYTHLNKEGSDLYFCLRLDFRDFIPDPRSPYELDFEVIKDAKRSSAKLKFMQEYMNYFIPTGESFFSLADLHDIQQGNSCFGIEWEGDGSSVYIIVCDPAETPGGDNFALSVWKLVESSKTIVPVYLKKWNDGVSMQKAAVELRTLQYKFGAKFIVSDTKGGGAELLKQLTKTERVSNPADSGDFKLLDFHDSKRLKGLPIVFRVSFASRLIEEMGWVLALAVEQKRLQIPVPDKTSHHPIKAEVSALLETMIGEIANITPKKSGQYMGFTSKKKKDFFTVAMMAAYVADLIFHDKLKSKRGKKRPGIVGVAPRLFNA